jgi:hypothetical protein
MDRRTAKGGPIGLALRRPQQLSDHSVFSRVVEHIKAAGGNESSTGSATRQQLDCLPLGNSGYGTSATFAVGKTMSAIRQ